MLTKSGASTSGCAPRHIVSERLSFFRTHHRFLHYAEFESVDEFKAHSRWAKEFGLAVLVLGAGSNVLFGRRVINTVVLKNRLPRFLHELDASTIEVSSTLAIAEVLKWCEARRLDSCYYLASVPATVGGALAMNAGRGRQFNRSILDYVESVKAVVDGNIRCLSRDDLKADYRRTIFTGSHSDLIVSAVLRFPAGLPSSFPRRERIVWSKEHQDHSGANCGSIFKEWDRGVLSRLQGLRIFGARYSPKTINWITTTGRSSWPIVILIRVAQALHRLKGKRATLEVIIVK